MSRRDRKLVFVACCVGVLALSPRSAGLAGDSSPRTADFERDIRPILAKRCLQCHAKVEPEGDLDLTSRESLVESGVITVGDPDDSELVRRISADDLDERMPPVGQALAPREIELLRSWIENGAKWPTHWAYRRLVKPEVPVVQAETLKNWPRTPIDCFIAQRLEEHGLQPSPEADRRTLFRRLSFDLTGLPPTAAEIDSFLNDRSTDAYEKRVDTLLASPHYGERAAQHWMDIVHFAESHGQEQDIPREHAWPYRDYLIRSFNEDKPYGRFVAEQVAGDVLYPDDYRALIATGFLAAGPWDHSSMVGTLEDSLDHVTAQYLDRDDIVTTVMSTFLSSSVHCARCHDHKFDPISQEEYYSLQAVFAGIDKAHRRYDPDPDVARQRSKIESEIGLVARELAESSPRLISADVQRQVEQWQAQAGEETTFWTPLTIDEMTSEGGASLEEQGSGTFRSDGKRPDKDVYVLTVQTHLPRVTALRLELMSNILLPNLGPGRKDDGNFFLSELKVFQLGSAAEGGETLLDLSHPQADFSPPASPIEAAIDGDPETAWGIAPETGKPHHAWFELSESVSVGQTETFRIELHQNHGQGSLIGLMRLLVTDAASPSTEDAIVIPTDVSLALRMEPEKRTTEQQRQLNAWVLTHQLEKCLQELPAQSQIYCGTHEFEPLLAFRPADGLREVRLLRGGLVTEPLDFAVPAALSCVPDAEFELLPQESQQEGARRAALAEWLRDERNVLTWRSIANRRWQSLIGQGLVETASDFGQMGASPTHPELLDWLAVSLLEQAGTLQSLDRMIVTSAAYRQSSQSRPEAAAVDANNSLLWRMNRRRLDAEQFHDALLVATGSLDAQMEGPSVKLFTEIPTLGFTAIADYMNFDPRHPGNHRRSVYRFLLRSLPDPLMSALDCPDASQLTAKRTVSVTALQTLATLNDKFVIRQSEVLAEQVDAKYHGVDRQAKEAFRTIVLREPTEKEADTIATYARAHGLPNTCRLLFNLNEFLFLD